MYHHRLVISYKGTNYFGWQDLGAIVEKPTVQASIHKVLKRICKYQSCSIFAASRTDAGVHAQGQVIKITIPFVIDSSKLLLGMNSLLPHDIRVLYCEPCQTEFNPNKDCKRKEYHYYFSVDPILNPVTSEFVAHISPNKKGAVTESIDIVSMQQACKLFVGNHDFFSFSRRDAGVASTVRNIFSCEIFQTQPFSFNNATYYIKIVGDGFLRQMIRYIAGALFSLGKNQLSQADIIDALKNRKLEKLSASAKSRGLHLIQLYY